MGVIGVMGRERRSRAGRRQQLATGPDEVHLHAIGLYPYEVEAELVRVIAAVLGGSLRREELAEPRAGEGGRDTDEVAGLADAVEPREVAVPREKRLYAVPADQSQQPAAV